MMCLPTGQVLLLFFCLGAVAAVPLPDNDKQEQATQATADYEPYGALSPSVQARLSNAKSEPAGEPYGALSPSVQSRLSDANTVTAVKPYAVNNHLPSHTSIARPTGDAGLFFVP